MRGETYEYINNNFGNESYFLDGKYMQGARRKKIGFSPHEKKCDIDGWILMQVTVYLFIRGQAMDDAFRHSHGLFHRSKHFTRELNTLGY